MDHQLIGRPLFIDGTERPVFLDRDGRQYVHDDDGQPVYGTWIYPELPAVEPDHVVSS